MFTCLILQGSARHTSTSLSNLSGYLVVSLVNVHEFPSSSSTRCPIELRRHAWPHVRKYDSLYQEDKSMVYPSPSQEFLPPYLQLQCYFQSMTVAGDYVATYSLYLRRGINLGGHRDIIYSVECTPTMHSRFSLFQNGQV